MISITELWCGKKGRSHELRYKKKSPKNIRPVVVWNSTKACNLKCIHCYSDATNSQAKNELTTNEVRTLIEDLSTFKTPALLLSGGEPLLRRDFSQILKFAKELSLPIAISTNGTLIDPVYAKFLKIMGVRYVGISIDGLEEEHDRFRGVDGSFKKAARAFEELKKYNVGSGLRLTLNKRNISQIGSIFKFIETTEINRVCFYHMVPVGRGKNMTDLIPNGGEIRNCLDKIIDWTETLVERNLSTEVLTVDNHADNIYLYLKKLKITNNGDAAKMMKCIKSNGGASLSSGVGIACIDAMGYVHPDQFWPDCVIGNIREKRFSEIWTDESNPVLFELRNKKSLIKGRCSRCKWLDICGGGLRSRAYAYFEDHWASDPGCYLSDTEIS